MSVTSRIGSAAVARLYLPWPLNLNGVKESSPEIHATIGGNTTITGYPSLDQSTLVNTGTVVFNNVYRYIYNGAWIEDLSSGSIDIDTTNPCSVGYGSATDGSFSNEGTLTVSGGSSAGLINVPFDNSGSAAIG